MALLVIICEMRIIPVTENPFRFILTSCRSQILPHTNSESGPVFRGQANEICDFFRILRPMKASFFLKRFKTSSIQLEPMIQRRRAMRRTIGQFILVTIISTFLIPVWVTSTTAFEQSNAQPALGLLEASGGEATYILVRSSGPRNPVGPGTAPKINTLNTGTANAGTTTGGQNQSGKGSGTAKPMVDQGCYRGCMSMLCTSHGCNRLRRAVCTKQCS